MFRNQNVGARVVSLPNDIDIFTSATAPVDGTSGTGARQAGPGSALYTTNGQRYVNMGTKASPAWVADANTISVTITKANILAMFTTPVTVVAAPGAAKVLEFLDAILVYQFGVAAYGGGGNVTLAYGSAGATLTEIVSAANSFGAAGDKVYRLGRLDPSGGILMPVNTPIVITNATGVFTDPGTAVGVGRLKISYRVHATGL